ncbi:hypothetical protein [Pseudomonas fontis]|uniref:Tail tape measure protein n=1 Tax=Pseudomonas fontis TaxID=2942633 RepID=A0ABT5NPL0_9PSED|nr:hypothetical protein [Pseudomonas fontis]MDD0972430.1 hypothetical protein [Pseudomonas fontis]MDD0990113.1 hypothetical protein [Pseudomonas fontis]
MASIQAVRLELGASVTFTVGIALKAVEDRIKKNTRVLESILGEVLRLREPQPDTPEQGVVLLGALRPYLDATLNLLQQQVIALALLRQQSQTLVPAEKAGAASAKSAEPKRDNLKVFEDLPVIGQAITYGKVVALPSQISAGYQKIVRDIAIDSGPANAGELASNEGKVRRTVSTLTETTGIERNQAATLIKQLQDTGMGLEKALAFAPVAAKFVVGQDAGTEDTAGLIGALQDNPNITGPAELERALDSVVYQRKGTGEDAAASLSASQRLGVDQAVASTQPSPADGVLDRDSQARRDTSDRRQTEASDAFDDALRSLGDSVQPLSDGVVTGFTSAAKAFTDAPDAVKWFIVGAAALGTTVAALKGGSIVTGLLDKGREWLKGKPTAQASGAGPVAEQAPKPKPKAKRKKGAKGKSASAPGPSVSSEKPPAATATARTVGKIGAAVKEVRGPAALEAGIKTVATFMTADTPEEKAEGYGAAAGGLVGTVIGGALGSFVPVVGTSIGALLGGMAGDFLGGWIGKRLASSSETPKPAVEGAGSNKPGVSRPGDVVRSLVSSVPEVGASPVLAKAAEPAIAAPQQITQQFTFTPSMPITVQGSITDPLLLTQNLEAMVRRQFEELTRMAASRQLADVPHVYV